MSRPSKLGVLLATALLTRGVTARADDTSSLESTLNESVVTTASSTAEAARSAPATSTTITSDEIRRYGMRHLAEVLNYLSLGFFASATTGNANGDVGARGMAFPQDGLGANEPGAHVLVLINGHVVNEPLTGNARVGFGWGIPLELVDHIEVINGPGSVLYGSNAMLGVINVVTKRAKHYDGVHVIAEADPTNYGRVSAGFGREFELFGKPSELTFQLEYIQRRGPDLRYPVVNTGIDPLSPSNIPTRYSVQGPPTGIWGGTASHVNYFDAPSALLRFVSGDFDVNLRGSVFRRGDAFFSRFAFDEPATRGIERSLFADVRYHRTLSTIVDVSARAYTDFFDRQQYIVEPQRGGDCAVFVDNCEIQRPSSSRWAGTELQSTFDWVENARFVTLLGFDGRLRYGKQNVDFVDALTGAPLRPSIETISYSDGMFGAYGQQTWQATRWLGFNGGARLDYDNRFPAVLSPRIAAVVEPWRQGTLKTIYVEAFRAPTFYESFNQVGAQLLSEGLRPERVRSVEATLEQRFGTQRLLFGAFRAWWLNMIQNHDYTREEVLAAFAQNKVPSYIPFTPFLQLSQARNVASIDNYGFEMAYEGTAAKNLLKYGTNATAAIARSDENGETRRLVIAPQIVSNAHVSYELPQGWPVLALAAKYFSRRLADRAYTGGFQPLPYAPPQLELRATASGPVPLLTGLKYRLSANYSFASQGPYSVGPVVRATPQFSQPFLNPIRRFESFIGLQYDFL
jgi:outer membrane receptor for ferrienterochelin and colicins